jgi:hypothetical protein
MSHVTQRMLIEFNRKANRHNSSKYLLYQIWKFVMSMLEYVVWYIEVPFSSLKYARNH